MGYTRRRPARRAPSPRIAAPRDSGRANGVRAIEIPAENAAWVAMPAGRTRSASRATPPVQSSWRHGRPPARRAGFMEEPIMSMSQEFKTFVMRGNVVDMAVGLIIGLAFGKIVSSFVADVIMPPIGLLLGNVNFTDLAFTLRQARDGLEAVTLNYGIFIQTLVDFLIVAFVIFLVIKGINALKKEQQAAPTEPPAPTKEELLLTEIRDLLRKE